MLNTIIWTIAVMLTLDVLFVLGYVMYHNKRAGRPWPIGSARRAADELAKQFLCKVMSRSPNVLSQWEQRDFYCDLYNLIDLAHHERVDWKMKKMFKKVFRWLADFWVAWLLLGGFGLLFLAYYSSTSHPAKYSDVRYEMCVIYEKLQEQNDKLTARVELLEETTAQTNQDLKYLYEAVLKNSRYILKNKEMIIQLENRKENDVERSGNDSSAEVSNR